MDDAMEKGKKPIYVELYEQFKKMIVEGKYEENQKLPSKRKLSADLKISPLTVEAAYQQLIAEGYVYAIEKSGYFVSKRVEVILGSKESTINLEKKEVEEKPKYLYEFNTNVVDTSLFPNATWAKLSREVLSENHHEMLNITNPEGMVELRREIARYLDLYRGMQVDPVQIIIGSGSSSLIGLLVEIIGRKSHYAMENPGYSKIYHLFRGNDVHLSLIDLDEMGIDINHLISSNANIVHITPSHQFPTGIVMPIQRRNELLNWANEKDNRFIIEDDYDSEFRFQGKPIPALQGLDYNEKVIYMNTFTKTLAPSFRMGYMVLPRKLLTIYNQIKGYHGCTVPNFEQYIMYKFMKGGYFERHVNRMKNYYRQKIELIMKIVEKYPKIRMKGYESGLHFLMEIDSKLSEGDMIQIAMNNKIRVSGLSNYIQGDSTILNKSLVIGYSGIELEKLNHAMNLLIQSVLEK
ncbi:MAG: GntR family transcriptional regulator [Tenericutes bacterium HGW-Tenericutes-2]|jgi:GntR family transcriptional regulator/MocR family aminotransferase|nr:MAG: GntR family transcriptional regulator [Tenericutes bacterium HGW-Tenericutes-2]